MFLECNHTDYHFILGKYNVCHIEHNVGSYQIRNELLSMDWQEKMLPPFLNQFKQNPDRFGSQESL